MGGGASEGFIGGMSSLEIGERSFCGHLLTNVVILRAVLRTDFSETNSNIDAIPDDR